MSGPRVSVIVVSHGRPASLVRTLTGLAQQEHQPFEVVVVADIEAARGVRRHPLGAHLKLVEFDGRNISAARNLGIAQAAGEILAFIDDDAVPEPTWLGFLLEGFARDDVAAATGTVLGRNGISVQWQATDIAPDGTDVPRELPAGGIGVVRARSGHAVKTVGTNAAFRAEALRAIGGFDPAFRFYLDEGDVNMRLAEAGHATAIVPMAVVHHGFAASERRAESRMPFTLYEIGASSAVFLRKHALRLDHAAALAALRDRQRARLVERMRAGHCMPDDVEPLLASFDEGVAAGARRALGAHPNLGAPPPFLPLRDAVPRPGTTVIAGRPAERAAMDRRAAEILAGGGRATVFRFSRSTLYHRVRFTDDGVWEHTGGIWGRSLRSGPIVQPGRFSTRIRREADRISVVRNVRELVTVSGAP